MSKFTTNQIIGILLLIAALLILVNIPFIDGKTIGTIIVIVLGIYNLLRK